MNYRQPTLSDQRKAQNRTKIQLGGLIIKSGLAELFDIEIGEDLQLDSHAQSKATELLGALIEIHQRLQDDTSLRALTDITGRMAMQQSFIQDRQTYGS